jgi:glycosyltransferase involved in cell wall biosynthesis
VGVRVVTTRVGAIPDVVGDGAALVEPRDPEALAAALDAALGGGDQLTAQIDRGRRRAEAFTWSACAAGLVGLYRDAVAGADR